MYIIHLCRDFALDTEKADASALFVETELDNRGHIRLSVPPGQPTPDGSTRATGLYLPMAGDQGEGFYDWFHTDPQPDKEMARNLQIVHSEALSDYSKSGSYTFSTRSFWPIDNELFGNEDDAHNRYFTWEIRTYLTYTPGVTFSFSSADDMWVFVDGKLPSDWPLGGIHPERTYVLDLDNTDRWPDLMPNGTYRMDLFYAHRSARHDPAIQIQLPSFFLCDGLSQGSPVVDWSDFSLAESLNLMSFAGALSPDTAYSTLDLTTQNMKANGMNNGLGQVRALHLVSSSTPGRSAAAYFTPAGSTLPEKLKILNGFRLEFAFLVSGDDCSTSMSEPPCAEGFAVVLHGNANPLVLGSAGSSLGYGAIDR